MRGAEPLAAVRLLATLASIDPPVSRTRTQGPRGQKGTKAVMTISITSLASRALPNNLPDVSPEQARLHLRSLDRASARLEDPTVNAGWRAFYELLHEALVVNLASKGITTRAQLEELAR